MGFFAKLFGLEKSKSSPCTCKTCDCGDFWITIPDFSADDRDIIKTLDPHIVVGKVLQVEAHPDPKVTKVRVSHVDFGDDNPVQILCGGTNLDAGQTVAVARVGAKLSEDFEIGVRKIRGVESNGMICARAELGLSAGSEKKGEIWVLPSSFASQLGKSLKEL